MDNELLYELIEYGEVSDAKPEYNSELYLGFLTIEGKESSANFVVDYFYKVALEGKNKCVKIYLIKTR